VYCWGFGYYGQNGSNTTDDSDFPTLVTDPSTLFTGKSIAALGVGGNNTFVVYK
jgi:alpha-tubulin suppressor-like RCC1 family protein